jgi:hypothetical protein
MNWPQVIDAASKLSALLGALIAGLWVLMLYIRGRMHQPRLRLRVSVDRVPLDEIEYLIVKAELENVGLTRVEVMHGGSNVTIYADQVPKGIEFAWGSEWAQLGDRFELLKDQRWVEPSALITDQLLIGLPGQADRFIKVWAHVESQEVAWNASAVVGRVTEV